MKTKPFVIQMKADIIPWLEDVIIRKEEEYIKKLLARRWAILNPPWYRKIIPGYKFFFQPVLKHVEHLIEYNKKELKYYYTKLAEYKNWVIIYEAA